MISTSALTISVQFADHDPASRLLYCDFFIHGADRLPDVARQRFLQFRKHVLNPVHGRPQTAGYRVGLLSQIVAGMPERVRGKPAARITLHFRSIWRSRFRDHVRCACLLVFPAGR